MCGPGLEGSACRYEAEMSASTQHVGRQYVIFRAAFRNFCGLPNDVRPHSHYSKSSPCLFVQTQWHLLGLESGLSDRSLHVSKLIEENLNDKQSARHLLLVCSGGTETAIGLVQSAASRTARRLQIMVGSTFPEDRSETAAASSSCICIRLQTKNTLWLPPHEPSRLLNLV